MLPQDPRGRPPGSTTFPAGELRPCVTVAVCLPLPPCFKASDPVLRGQASSVLPSDMDLTQAERPVVTRAVAAYRNAKEKHVGQFRGLTADAILEELAPSPVRWTKLASFVIASAHQPLEHGAQGSEPWSGE
jgi:hypothetical protein